MLEGDFAIITVQVHSVVSQSITMGWQGMVRTACIVACTFARIVSEEYTTCIHNFFCQLLVIGCGDNQMLWCISIAEVDCLLFGLYEDKLRIV